jgi:hypothetical protein
VRPVTAAQALQRHPASARAGVRRIGVELSRSSATLALSFRLEGDLDRLCIPRRGEPDSGDPLWRHTCFEAFVARRGARGYHELNFSSAGAWAAYAFSDYRSGGPVAPAGFEPWVAARRTRGALELDASVNLAALAPHYALAALEIGASAVIEERGGTLSYWALAHAAEAPDFHDRRTFSLSFPEWPDGGL